MKMQKIQTENLKETLINLDSMLNQIEVKGTSVSLLYSSRGVLNQLFQLIEDVEERKVNEEEEEHDI